jgi:hypothetical protein
MTPPSCWPVSKDDPHGGSDGGWLCRIPAAGVRSWTQIVNLTNRREMRPAAGADHQTPPDGRCSPKPGTGGVPVVGVGSVRGWSSTCLDAAAGLGVLAVLVEALGTALQARPIGGCGS